MKKRKASSTKKARTARIAGDVTVFPFLELPMEIFRSIASVLHDPSKATNENVKNLFITSNAVRQKYMKVFMEFLWFELNGKRKLPFSDRIENLYRPTKTIDLSLFKNLRALNISIKTAADVEKIPPQITFLDINSSYEFIDMDLSPLTNLRHLIVFSLKGSQSSRANLKLGLMKLESLVASRVTITEAFDYSHLKKIRLVLVLFDAPFRLQHSVSSFFFFGTLFIDVVELARGDEVKELSQNVLELFSRGNDSAGKKICADASPGTVIDDSTTLSLRNEDKEILNWWLQK